MQNGLQKYGIAALTLCLLAACSKTPDGILSEKEMQAVELDIQLAKAMISVENKQFADSLQRAELFQSVFRKHGITQAVYDSSLIWYGRNLDIYMDIYDRILKDLNERQNALGDVQASAAPVSTQDSVDIWPRRSFVRLEPRAAFNGVTFDIRPEVNYSSGSSFVLSMSVWGISGSSFVLSMSVWGMDQLKAQQPEIRICADLGDTTVVVNDKVRKDGYHETVLKTIPTKRVKRVYGYIFLNNAGLGLYYHKVYLNNLTLIKYNYGRELPNVKPADVQPKAIAE